MAAVTELSKLVAFYIDNLHIGLRVVGSDWPRRITNSRTPLLFVVSCWHWKGSESDSRLAANPPRVVSYFLRSTLKLTILFLGAFVLLRLENSVILVFGFVDLAFSLWTHLEIGADNAQRQRI